MFSELEKLVIAHSGNSPRHYQVLECLMQVRFINNEELLSNSDSFQSRLLVQIIIVIIKTPTQYDNYAGAKQTDAGQEGSGD